jgi:predicted outer membrane repeat protein
METDALCLGRAYPALWILKRMLIMLVAATSFWLATDVAHAATVTFIVNTTDYSVDTIPGNGSCADTNGKCSLRAAIMEANATPGSGSTTIIVPAGTYTLTSSLSITSNVTIIGAGGDSNGDPKSTIIQAGTIPGSGTDRVFDINPNLDKDLNVTIQSVWARYGKASGGYGGGGIAADAGANVAVTNTILIDNCYISNNISSSAADGGGGLNLTGGKSNGTLKVTRTTVINNTEQAGYGGGIYVQSYGPFIMDTSSVELNTSMAKIGGGMYLEGTGGNTITNSTIDQNTAASSGGGIYTNSSLTMDNTTINGNTATLDGGGVYINSTSASLFRNNTINANKSSSGNGGGIHVQSNAGNVELHNNIVAGNSKSGSVASDISGNSLKVASSTNNLIGTGGAGGLTNGTSGNLTGVTNVLLGPLANNGGTTKTQALLPGSPALDAGDNTKGPVSVYDQRGFARKAHAAGAGTSQIIDIGAFEANPTIQTIPDQTMNSGETLQIPFYVGDVSLGTVTTTATSGNTTLLPVADLNISGTGANRTLKITPALGQQGTTTVTITASFSATGQSVNISFNLTVHISPDLTINKSHIGNFHQNQTGAQYTINVNNIGTANTSGTVTVTDISPAGLAITSLNGTGWTCQTSSTFTCTRSDVLAPGSSYPSITVTADVAGNATASITNAATVSGGGDTSTANNSASDPTTVDSDSTINPATGSFDKKLSAQADVITTMTLNGNTLSNITNGASVLVLNTDYTVSSNNVTIKKEYLATQPVGTTTLTFTLRAGATQTIAITVSDTTPKNSTISPITGSFDKK